MDLTLQERHYRDPNQFPTTQLFLLALCRVAEPIALTSILPYAFPLVRQFKVGDENSASFYAGLLISAFALCESFTGMFWGILSDRVGRKPVLLLGCAGTVVSLLIVGFSTNIWVALAGRAVGGLLNGNMGVIQTMVGELVSKPEHEPRAYAVMPFVWSIGTIIGPAIGGTCANPAETFPSLFSSSGLFGHFPYLLPNIICAGLLVISIALGYFLLEETHPDLQTRYHPVHDDPVGPDTAHLATQASLEQMPVDLRAEDYGTFNSIDMRPGEIWMVDGDGSSTLAPHSPKRAFTKKVILLVVALSIFTYHSMTYDHLLPIFLQDKRKLGNPGNSNGPMYIPGGLGMTLQSVGAIMAVNGIIALFIQALVFPIVATWLGVWRLFIVVTVLHPIAYFIVPFLALLPPNWVNAGIYFCLVIRNLCAILVYPVILILLKEATPLPSALGKVNGLAASAGAACRTVAPPIAGYLYGLGASLDFTGLAWWGSGAVAIAGSIQCFLIQRDKYSATTVQSVAHGFPAQDPAHKAGVVHIIVQGDEVDV
ncbi:MAG: hypothetical protein M1825_001209 [Sarcosagium campestre]|nr:MAG: hypothetical protein M1825_001209 [Sarcosagium campestre]